MVHLSPSVLEQAKQLEAAHPDAMVGVFDHSGYYLYASPTHSKLIEYTPDELLKKTLPDIVAPEDLAHTQLGFMDAVLHGKSVVISVNLVSKSGRRVAVKAEARAITDPDYGTDLLLGLATPADLVKD